MERRIERAIAYMKNIGGDLPQTLADSPAMERFQRQDLENQQIQGALDQIGGFAHAPMSSVTETMIEQYALSGKGKPRRNAEKDDQFTCQMENRSAPGISWTTASSASPPATSSTCYRTEYHTRRSIQNDGGYRKRDPFPR